MRIAADPLGNRGKRRRLGAAVIFDGGADHPAGIGNEVRQRQHALRMQHRFRFVGRRNVGALRNQLRLHTSNVVGPQHIRPCTAMPWRAGRTDLPWQVIGGGKVSTGQAGRHAYFITPTGVFRHTADILDYRALGTLNENGIRGLGVKGMRVWDLGWQMADKGWTGDHEQGEIRLLLHATDPDYLEQRLGRPASKGCVRIAAAMNRFLDLHGVLDADYERAARDDARFRALLLPERRPTMLSGDALVIVDSSAA